VRLFVAVIPPDDVLDVVAALARPAMPGVRWTTREQWHVTLRFLGEVEDPEPVVDALEDAPLGGPREIRLGPAVEALGRKVVCVPASGAEQLADDVVAATRELGRPPDDRPFRGHLTLARLREGSGRRLAGAPIDAAWRCTAVAIVRSRPHPHGARYEVVNERRLQ
jgi:2'-5' RNA ligase